MSRRRIIETSVVTVAILAGLLPTSSVLVERWFSSGIYPQIQRLLTPAANLMPVAWLDILLIAAVAGLAVLVVRTWRQVRRERRARPAIAAAWTVVVTVAAVYLVFLNAWGWNYRRIGMTDRV